MSDRLPPVDLLDPTAQLPNSEDDAGGAIETLAKQHGVDLEVVGYDRGAAVTRYLVAPGPGVAPRRVEALTDALSVALGHPVRYAGIVGAAIAIEVANERRSTVTLRHVIETAKACGSLAIYAGQDVTGHGVCASLSALPHLLIGGATGQGKSVTVNAILIGLMMRNTPADVRLTLVDPKRVELAAYARSPHLHRPIVTDVGEATTALEEAAKMMDARYAQMEAVGARSIAEYNDKADKRWPAHVIVIDELADLVMQNKAVEAPLVRIAQKGRAAGVHLVLATQYPTAKVVLPLLGQNVPSRMALTTTNHTASNVIIGQSGAERLSGKGDALWSPVGTLQPVRIQSPYVSDDEIARVVAWWVEHEAPARAARNYESVLAEARARDAQRMAEEAQSREVAERKALSQRAREILDAPPRLDPAPVPPAVSLDDQVKLSVIDKARAAGVNERVEVLEAEVKRLDGIVRLLVLSSGMDISLITQ